MQIGKVPEAATTTTTRSLQASNYATFLSAEANHLRNIAEHSKLSTKALKDSQGDHVISGSLPLIMQKFGTRPDVDSAKMYGAQIHRFNVNVVAESKVEIEKMLTDRAEDLDAWSKMIREAEAATEEDGVDM